MDCRVTTIAVAAGLVETMIPVTEIRFVVDVQVEVAPRLLVHVIDAGTPN